MKADTGNYIYILGFIVYIIYSIYKANAKRKAKINEMLQKREKDPSDENNVDPSYTTESSQNKNIFDELLNDGFEFEEERPSNYYQPDPQKKQVNEFEIQEPITEVLDAKKSTLDVVTEEGSSGIKKKKTVEVKRTTKKNTGLNEKFNLRKAVIYNAILNRPYQ